MYITYYWIRDESRPMDHGGGNDAAILTMGQYRYGPTVRIERGRVSEIALANSDRLFGEVALAISQRLRTPEWGRAVRGIR
jgi:hypothetical protein